MDRGHGDENQSGNTALGTRQKSCQFWALLNKPGLATSGHGLGQGKQVDRDESRERRAIDQVADLLSFIESIEPLDSERKLQAELHARIKTISDKAFPGSRLEQFGSTVNGFSLQSADLDFCLFIDKPEQHFEIYDLHLTKYLCQVGIVVRLGEELRKDEEFFNIKVLSRARIPIIKLRDKVTGISCDIGVNNELAMYNTELLRCYSDIDQRLVQLARIVKYWAKNRSINEPYSGTLSSYCYTIMIIFYLQNISPPVLPVLQRIDIHKDKENSVQNQPEYLDRASKQISKIVEGRLVEFPRSVEHVTRIWPYRSKNQANLYSLLQGFFKFYAYEFPFATSVVSIRTGCLVPKTEKDWTLENSSTRNSYWFCVEDPFELEHNLARSVSKSSLYFIRGQFIRGSKLMSQNVPIKSICSNRYY